MNVLCAWRSRSLWRSAAALFLLVLLVGCGSTSLAPASPTASSPPIVSEVRSVSTGTTRTYLGAVSGTQALLGIVLNGTQVRAYICDGTPHRLATLVEWFAGQVKGGNVEASSQDQQARLSAQLTDQHASGTLRLASGRVYSFSLPQVPATARVGVFEGTATISGQRYHAGWLLLPDGEERGAATYYLSSSVRGQTVIALLPEFPSSPI